MTIEQIMDHIEATIALLDATQARSHNIENASYWRGARDAYRLVLIELQESRDDQLAR
jgi:hypothetical protein